MILLMQWITTLFSEVWNVSWKVQCWFHLLINSWHMHKYLRLLQAAWRCYNGTYHIQALVNCLGKIPSTTITCSSPNTHDIMFTWNRLMHASYHPIHSLSTQLIHVTPPYHRNILDFGDLHFAPASSLATQSLIDHLNSTTKTFKTVNSYVHQSESEGGWILTLSLPLLQQPYPSPHPNLILVYSTLFTPPTLFYPESNTIHFEPFGSTCICVDCPTWHFPHQDQLHHSHECHDLAGHQRYHWFGGGGTEQRWFTITISSTTQSLSPLFSCKLLLFSYIPNSLTLPPPCSNHISP